MGNENTLPLVKENKEDQFSSSLEKELRKVRESLNVFETERAQEKVEKTVLVEALGRIEAQLELMMAHFSSLKQNDYENKPVIEKNEEPLEKRLEDSIENTFERYAKGLGEKIGKEAARTTEFVARQLAKASYEAQDLLKNYHTHLLRSHWRTIGVSIFTTITTCLLLVWLVIPKPTLMSNEQIKLLHKGMQMEAGWHKLSSWEQAHWKALSNKIESESYPDR